MDFHTRYAAYQAAIEQYLEGLFSTDKPYGRLQEAMRYSLLSGGKRIRPVLTLEFARLAGLDPRQVGNNPFSGEYTMAKDFGITVLLKGFVTGITGPAGRRAFHFGGCDGLAKGGSGDVLTGHLGGLLARGLPPERAALWGAWAHGRAAQLAAADHSRDAMLPSMLPDYFGRAFLEAEQERP